MQITKPGIYDAVPMHRYVADPCPSPSLSRGAIVRLAMATPASAYLDHPRLGGSARDHSSATDRGSAAHTILLGGDEQIVWVEANDWRTKAAKAERDEARAAGRIPLLAKKRDVIEDMVTEARAALSSIGGDVGSTEQTVCWLEGDEWCRCRPDWVSSPGSEIVIDYKTTDLQGGPDAFIRGMIDRGNDIGAQWQLRGLHRVSQTTVARDFVFLVQEAFEPYLCYSVALSPSMEEMADEKIEHALRLWRQCRASKRWPGYPADTHYAEPPAYAVFDWEARKAMLEMRARGDVS